MLGERHPTPRAETISTEVGRKLINAKVRVRPRDYRRISAFPVRVISVPPLRPRRQEFSLPRHLTMHGRNYHAAADLAGGQHGALLHRSTIQG